MQEYWKNSLIFKNMATTMVTYKESAVWLHDGFGEYFFAWLKYRQFPQIGRLHPTQSVLAGLLQHPLVSRQVPPARSIFALILQDRAPCRDWKMVTGDGIGLGKDGMILAREISAAVMGKPIFRFRRALNRQNLKYEHR